MKSKKKYWVGGLIILVAFSVLVFQGLNRSMMTYLNVRDLNQPDVNRFSKTIQVTGIVQPGSIEKVFTNEQVKFLLQDLEEPDVAISVTYQGILPDNFKPGIQVVAQGILETSQSLRAEKIFVKCPSKYEASE